MLVAGYAVIVFLTGYLIAMNVRAAVRQFLKDKNEIRLYSFLSSLVIAGALIIGLSGVIVQKVLDAQSIIFLEMANSPLQRYHIRKS